MKNLIDTIQAVVSGKPPEGNQAVSDCLIHLLQANIHAYVTGDGSRVETAMADLLEAAQQHADPTMRDLGLVKRQMALQAVAALLNAKESVRGQEAEQPPRG